MNRVTALLVMPQERSTALLNHLTKMEASVIAAGSCGEAAELLREEPGVGVVLTDLCLPDGSWFDVLNRVSDASPWAQVVVCARVADERLWTQVLEAGGFDVLVEPYQDREVRRILGAAASGRPRHHLAAAS